MTNTIEPSIRGGGDAPICQRLVSLYLCPGVTFAFTWVSMCQYTAISVPSVSLATVQGIIHGVYFGLGNGVGHLIGGLAIDAYGAPATFYAAAVVVVVWLVLFVICQKVCHSLVSQLGVKSCGRNQLVSSSGSLLGVENWAGHGVLVEYCWTARLWSSWRKHLVCFGPSPI